MTHIIKSLRSGQITIPADVRRKLGITDDTFLQLSVEKGELRIKPVQVSHLAHGSAWMMELYDYFAPAREEAVKKNLTEEEINAAIDKAVTATRQSHASHRH